MAETRDTEARPIGGNPGSGIEEVISPIGRALQRWRNLRSRFHSMEHHDTGAATAEYAIATLAAVGFAGLLVVILRSDQVRGMLTDLIERALTVAG